MERAVRTGELTEESLSDAIAAELEGGRRPFVLAVGSTILEVRALRILGPGGGPLDVVRSVMPRVAVDARMDAEEWELREDAEHAVGGLGFVPRPVASGA